MLKLDAFGIDGFAPNGEPYLFREDWLTYPLNRGCWGTVLSYMAFSNHFLHHYLKESPAVQDYARRYLEILESLKPNGCFIYTPGLAFIEELLPRDRFHIKVQPIAEAHGTRFDEALYQVAFIRSTFIFWASPRLSQLLCLNATAY